MTISQSLSFVVILYVGSGHITTLQLHGEWISNPVTTVKQIKRYKLCQNISSQAPPPATLVIG